MSASAFAAELRAAGCRCTVDAFDRLAVLMPHDGHPRDPQFLRDVAMRLAPLHGFTHVALELVEPDMTPVTGAPLHRG